MIAQGAQERKICMTPHSSFYRITNHHNSRKIATMKISCSAIVALALALPSVVDGKPCSYEKHSDRKCKSRSGGNGADEVIMGPNRDEW